MPDHERLYLKPYDARLMRCYPVSTRINHVANDDEDAPHPWSLQKLKVGCSRSRSVELAPVRNQSFAGLF